jgi:iron(III) transport system substrate-binding protein
MFATMALLAGPPLETDGGRFAKLWGRISPYSVTSVCNSRSELMKLNPLWYCIVAVSAAMGAFACGAEVVVYSSVDDVFARPICEQYQKQTGITVKLVPDTEETKSTGLINRLIAEKKRPQCDVFWSGDPVRAGILKNKGVSAPYESPAAAGLPPEFSDAEHHFTGFSTRARVIIYNSNLVAPGDVPRSVRDLINAKWKGRACMANPLFGTTSMHAVAWFETIGDEDARKFFAALAVHDVRILSSNGEVKRRVAAGDFAFGLTDTDDALGAMAEGKPVNFVLPDQDGSGTLLVPNAAVLIAGAPHPAEAKKFIDYLLSAETERALAQSEAAQIPLRAGIPGPQKLPPLTKIKALPVDYAKLAARLDVLQAGFLKEWVSQRK